MPSGLRLICAVLALSQSPACTPVASHRDAGGESVVQVSAARARVLVLERYRELFGQLYLRSSETNDYYRFPQLDEALFTDVQSQGDAWIVRADPPAGWYVHARVAKSGAWVEITRAGFSAY